MANGNNSSWVMNESDGYVSLSASFSLTAEPLPLPPSPSEVPPELVQTVQENRHLFRIFSPINVDRLEAYTVDHPNRPFVKSILRCLRQGFHPKLEDGVLMFPITYDGSRRVRSGSEVESLMIKQRDEEVRRGRYSPSFGTELLPGMHALPQCVVRKYGKARVVTDNTSGPYAPNSLLPKEQYSVVGDKIEDFIRTLCQTKLIESNRTITLFKSDVSTAYRVLPMHPYWQARQVVKIQGQYHVDRCNSFGCRASGYFFYAFYSLVLWVAEHKRGIHNLFTYIDDNFSFDFEDNMCEYKRYGAMMPRKQALLLQLWDELGIPHEQKKQEHGPELDIIGCAINVRSMRILLPERTRTKLLTSIADFVPSVFSGGPFTDLRKPLQDFQKLVGIVNWASKFHHPLRLGVVSMRGVMFANKGSGDESQNPQLVMNKAVIRELAWLIAHIQHWKGTPLYNIIPKSALEIHCEATYLGIGFHCESKNRGYQERVSLYDDNIYANVYAIVRAIEWACTVQPRTDSVRIYCRNEAAVTMFQDYRPPKLEYNILLMHSVDCITRHDIVLQVSDESSNETAFQIAALLADGCEGDLRKMVTRHYHIVQREDKRSKCKTG